MARLCRPPMATRDPLAPAPQSWSPFSVALAIGLAAQILFTYGLGRPSTLVFDETHYVPAARHMLLLDQPWNIEHPLFGKALIALGMRLYGDNAIGWRALSTLAGSATVMGMFAIAWLLTGRMRTAIVTALLVILNLTVFIQARIAMLDGFMAAFVVTGLAALLWAMRAPPERVKERWVFGAALLGLAVGTKWAAIPYVALAGLAFLVAKLRAPRLWPELTAFAGLAMLGLVSVGVYLATFAPAFFYDTGWMTFGSLIPHQFVMLEQQRQVLPSHPYQSDWWSWGLMIRPIWYLYENVDGAQRGILLLGNPAILWGGLVAAAALLVLGAARRSAVLLAPPVLWLFSWLIWAAIPKSLGFFYYYYLSTIFLPLVIALAFQALQRGTALDAWFVAFAAGLFVYFYPIIAATALPDPQAFQNWMWLKTWP